MRTLVENPDEFLRTRGIKASYQRIRIFDYMQNSTSHPSVAKIFEELHPQIPSLSRATVYNTLNLFLEKDLVTIVNTEGAEARYDIKDPHHGHFTCDSCGEIFDVDISFTMPAHPQLRDFKIQEIQVHYRGLCPKCLKK